MSFIKEYKAEILSYLALFFVTSLVILFSPQKWYTVLHSCGIVSIILSCIFIALAYLENSWNKTQETHEK